MPRKTEDEILEPYASRPDERIVVTFKARRLLKEPALLEGMEQSAQVTGVWIGTDRGGRIAGLNYRPLAPGGSPASALEEYRQSLSTVIPFLELSRPSPSAYVPRVEDYGVYSLVVKGTPAEVTSFRNAALSRALGVRAVEAVTEAQDALRNRPGLPPGTTRAEGADSKATAGALDGPAAAAASTAPRKFLPNRGRVSVFARTEDGREYRYMVHWLQWDNQQSINDFFEDDAYEHQFLLNKRSSGDGVISPGLYLKDPGTWGLIARPKWGTSWDGGYLDSSVLNSTAAGDPNETDYTIGCIEPRRLLRAGEWYYLWAKFEKGDADTDVAKLTGEAKQRALGCIHPFCVIGPRAVTQWMVNAWNIRVPTGGDYYWIRPQVTEVTTLTSPVAGRQFFVKVRGGGFDPNRVHVVIVGPGCTIFGACQVPNLVLRQLGSVTATDIPRVPLTLGAGTYQLYAVNGSTFSNQVGKEGFTVTVAAPPVSISNYTWNTTPRPGQPFGGTVNGTGFVPVGTQVWFCVSGTATCYQQPAAGITINNSTSLTLSNVNLGAGSWQFYVRTAAGQSARSAAFTVQAALPTITSYSWSTVPTAGQPFSGTILGTGFVSGGTQVWFCVNSTNTCYQQPAAGVTVTSRTSLNVSNVNLGGGTWQIFVRTAAGQSARSAAFTVQAQLPTITSYSWNTVPRAGQPFSGTITGTRFVPGGTQVWFCISGSSTCYQQPAAGVAVSSSTSLTVSNVNLGGGTWQILVRTSAGQSARSTVFTVQAAPLPTITGYTWSTTPKANQPFSGTISGTGFVSGGTQVWFCVNGSTTCYQHPAAGITVSSSTSLGVSGVNLGAGTWQFFVRTAAGQSVRSTAFTVQAPTPPPTLTGYSWNTTPKANQPFGGTVTGTGFVSGGTQVWFCVNGSTTCYQHPAAGVNVNSSTSLTVSGVNLGAGAWQLYVKTSAGPSGRSAAFTVQAPAPTVTGYSWNTTPTVNQSFGGTVTGTGFVAGGTQVWFCVSGSGTCYQHPAAGVTVSSSTSLSVSGVNLGAGAWQLYVQTSAGQSTRSTTFTVQAASPTIAGYSWNTTPRPGQPFGGTISGSGFVPGGTQVWFCVSGTGTCYQQPAAGVNVNSSTNLTVSGVNLGSGWWQFYVQTSAGQSGRSASFNVQAGAPTISGYSWSTTPAAGQPFGGTIFGTDFITGGTRVWFCIYDSATCYEHPAAGVNVNSSSNLSVNGVNLGNGWWQFFLQSSAGQSPRSTPFSVR